MVKKEMKIEWKPCGSSYMVSNDGQVWSNKTNKLLKQSLDTYGYPKVKIDGKTIAVHLLVARAFIPNSENKKTVNHKDENKTNNCVENLEWVDDYDNNRYGTHDLRCSETKRRKYQNGEYDVAVSFGAKAVEQYDLEGNFINEFESSAAASRATGINANGIANVARGKQRTSGGYVWKYKKDTFHRT